MEKKLVEEDDFALIFFNRNATTPHFALNWSTDLKISNDVNYSVRDLWAHKDLGVFNTVFKAQISVHEARIYKFTKSNNKISSSPRIETI